MVGICGGNMPPLPPPPPSEEEELLLCPGSCPPAAHSVLAANVFLRCSEQRDLWGRWPLPSLARSSAAAVRLESPAAERLGATREALAWLKSPGVCVSAAWLASSARFPPAPGSKRPPDGPQVGGPAAGRRRQQGGPSGRALVTRCPLLAPPRRYQTEGTAAWPRPLVT